MAKQLALPQKPTKSKKSTVITQKIRYDCGCEAIGLAPMPVNCPTHAIAQSDKSDTKKEILLSIILDESGSMSHARKQTVDGINEYLNGIRQDPNANYLVTLSKFDSSPQDPQTCRVIYKLKPLSEVSDLSESDYAPRGGTPLNDAVGVTVTAIDEEVNGRPVLVVIATDGEENTSRKFNSTQIRQMITEREARGNWTFVFLGADQNAWMNAQKFGVQQVNTMSYASANTQAVYSALSGRTMMRSAAVARGSSMSACMGFFDTPAAEPTKPPLTPDALSAMASYASQKRMTSMTPKQRSAVAKKAAEVRWKPKP